ncbi:MULTISPECIES: hypothetical protein [Methylobacterium]|uniref:ABC transporter permease n=1 Tax=Methylobacterium longum TaxID=767694 RepID=A0ABT8ARE5_9HYPH|nr:MULTISPECIES: hypothetical protein [Methylobacterium]MDN3572277.1 hypothetical protein [Methylobacterium longum]
MAIRPSPRRAAPPSLFRSGLGPRLALAGALSAVVWLVIAWALTA